MGVQGAVYVYRRAVRGTGVARRDGKVFWVGWTPSETVCAFGEGGTA